MPHPPDETPEEPLKLDLDCACRQCGYNLRGLAVDGQCPECGDSVADSLKIQHYWGADTQYMLGVTRGVDKLMLCSSLILMTPFIGCFLAYLLGAAARASESVMITVAWLYVLGIWLFWFIGIWQIGQRESQHKKALEIRLQRIASRAFTILGPILIVVYLYLPRLFLLGWSELTWMLILSIGVALLYGGIVSFTLIITHLAKRAHDTRLLRGSKLLLVIITFVGACQVLLVVSSVSGFVPLGHGIFTGMFIASIFSHMVWIALQLGVLAGLRKHLVPTHLFPPDELRVYD